MKGKYWIVGWQQCAIFVQLPSVCRAVKMSATKPAAAKQEAWWFIIERIVVCRNLPALWDVKSKECSARKKKTDAYEVFLTNYKDKFSQADREDNKNKINSLRNNIRKQIRKIVYCKKMVIVLIMFLSLSHGIFNIYTFWNILKILHHPGT